MPAFPNHLSLNENRILSQLPEEEQRRLRPELESVSLTLTQVLYEPGDRLEYAYFPQRGMISLVSMTERRYGTGSGPSGSGRHGGLAPRSQCEDFPLPGHRASPGYGSPDQGPSAQRSVQP